MRFEEIESVPNAKSMTSESAANFLFKHNGYLMKIATIFLHGLRRTPDDATEKWSKQFCLFCAAIRAA